VYAKPPGWLVRIVGQLPSGGTIYELQTIVSHCLAHARRNCVDVYDRFPEGCGHLRRFFTAAGRELANRDPAAYGNEVIPTG